MTATRTRRHPLRVAIAVLGLALAAVAVPSTPAAAAEADTLHALLNQARWSNGLAGLVRNPAMDAVAADWAAELAASGTLSHNPDYSSQIPGGWVRAAENVAQGYPTAGAMHDGWMNSAGHRANILGDYTDVGIAFLAAGGTTWGVQVFAAYPGHVGPAPPAQAPAPAPPAEPAPTTPTPEATPSASPTPTPTPSDPATPVRRPAADPDAASDDSPLPLVLIGAAILAAGVAAGVGVLLRRRGTRPEG